METIRLIEEQAATAGGHPKRDGLIVAAYSMSCGMGISTSMKSGE